MLSQKPKEPTQSPTIGELAEALAKAQGMMDFAKKDADNPFFRSRYADLSACWEVCRGPLAQNNLAVVQTTRPTTDGSVSIISSLLHSSGEWIRGELAIKPVKDDPQGIGSAMTYARRYGLCALVGIVADEDDDAEGAMGRPQQAPKPLPQERQAKSQGRASKASEAQINAIFAISKDKGQEAHHAATTILGRNITSLNVLTSQEASTIISRLKGVKNA